MLTSGSGLQFRKSGRGLLHFGREIRHFLSLPNFDDLIARRGALRRPGDRLLPRLDVNHPGAAEHFLGLGEWTIGHNGLAGRERDPRTHRGRMQAIERDQHAGVFQGLVVFHHRRHALGIELDVRWRGFVAQGNHQHHESHGGVLVFCSCHSGAREARTRNLEIPGPREDACPGMTAYYFFPACARRRASCSRSSGVSASPKSSVSKTCRISISAPPSNGARFIHSIASSRDFTWISQKPAMRSLVTANGPWLTLSCFPEYFIRAPFDVGCRPSPASMTPALTISSLNLPIAVSNSVPGITPASVSLFAFTITMNRIVALRFEFHSAGRAVPPPKSRL